MRVFVEWLRHLFNPHCEECMIERAERRVCESCETLKQQISYYQRLIDKLTNKEEIESVPELPTELKPIQTRHVPFRVKREALEAEARETARILRERQGEIRKAGIKVNIATHPSMSTEELEKELGITEEEKEG